MIPSEPSPKKNVNNFKNAILSKEKFLNALNIKTAKAIEFSNKFRNEKENFYQVLVKNQNLSIQIHEMQEQIIKKKHILAKLKANTNNRYETKKTIKNLIEILLGVELKNLHFIENKEYYLKCRFEKICDLNLFLLLENNGNLFINYNITGCDLSHYESFQEIIIIVMEEFVIEAKNYSNFNECFKNFCFLIKYVSSFFEILLNFYSIWKEKFFIEFYIVNKRLCLKMMSFEKIELIFSQANWLAEPIMLVWRKKEKEITFNKFQKTINEILCNELVGEFELENIIKEFLL